MYCQVERVGPASSERADQLATALEQIRRLAEQPPAATSREEYQLLLDTRRAYAAAIPFLKQAVEITVSIYCLVRNSLSRCLTYPCSSPRAQKKTQTSSVNSSTIWWRCCGTFFFPTKCTTLSFAVRSRALPTPPGKSNLSSLYFIALTRFYQAEREEEDCGCTQPSMASLPHERGSLYLVPPPPSPSRTSRNPAPRCFGIKLCGSGRGWRFHDGRSVVDFFFLVGTMGRNIGSMFSILAYLYFVGRSIYIHAIVFPLVPFTIFLVAGDLFGSAFVAIPSLAHLYRKPTEHSMSYPQFLASCALYD